MIIVKPDKLKGLVPRMLELTSRTTPWHRRDWRAGTLELVEEALNEAMIPGTKEGALVELREYMTAAIGHDDGVTPAQKKLIRCARSINTDSDLNSHNVQLAHHHAKDLKLTYLANWANIFDSPEQAGRLDVEGTAKRIISHVLYCGVPAPSVYKIIHERETSPIDYKFSDVLRELDARTKLDLKEFNFAIPVDHAPSFLHNTPKPKGWFTPKELKQWKNRHAPRAATIRHQGGFILTVRARDVNEAAAEVQCLLSQLSFKFKSGSDNGFSVLPMMWSKEKGTRFPTRRPASSFKIRAFQRAGVLDGLEISPKTRNILAILEPLQTNDSHVAVVNGWVALESLLVDSGEDDRLGAERMARVVAASYFRTELTWLARNYAERYKNESRLANQISSSATSIERARLMIRVINEEKNFSYLEQVDQLSIAKMREALENPSAVFDRTQKILEREFLRLYRKRNLIVHSGRALEHGIESIADKVVPLLINGIDQLLIASIQHDLDPKAMAASVAFKALHLSSCGNSTKYLICDLLEVE